MNVINDIQEYVKPDIKHVEECILEQAKGYFPDISIALELLLSAGGKRIRPTITLLAGKMLGSENKRLITLASAIELLHTATLVHDDLIDESLLRRGNPTLNAKWSPSATILTGDFLFACAAKLAAETDSLSVMKLFSQTLITIVNGEIIQLMNPIVENRKKAYFERIYAKTASLFETSTCSAALISPADDETVARMKNFGRNIGLAFQILDDVLDFIGSEEQIGKPIGGDVRQGIITLPLLIYSESYPDDELVKLLFNNKKLDDSQVEKLIESVTNSNAINLSLDEANHYTDQAIAYLNKNDASKEKNMLENLAHYLVNRHT